MLDYGCGSGILAIAAAKLGATDIVATDIDPQALEATVENTRRNELPENSIFTCLPEATPSKQYDVVVANILSGPLIKLAPQIMQFTHKGTRVALSGILAEQREAVSEAYAPYLEDMVITQKEEWLRIAGTVN